MCGCRLVGILCTVPFENDYNASDLYSMISGLQMVSWFDAVSPVDSVQILWISEGVETHIL